MPQFRKPPKRLNKTKTVHVEAYDRTIHAREYYIICKKCNRDVSRQSFGGIPLYCERCRPPTTKKKSITRPEKKLPRPATLEVVDTTQIRARKAR